MQDFTHYAGFDWAKDHHALVVVDRQGRIVADFEFEHTLEGWKGFAEKISAWPNLAIAIETSQGAAVDQLRQRECLVLPEETPGGHESRRGAPMPIAFGQAAFVRISGLGFRIFLRFPSLDTKTFAVTLSSSVYGAFSVGGARVSSPQKL